MVAALVIFLAQAAAVPSDAQIQGWIEDLASPLAHERAHAARRLLEAGDSAAEALEEAKLEDPEAIMRARDLLTVLRRPTVVVRGPPFVGPKQKSVVVEVLIRNPRPAPLVIQPFYFLKGKRGQVRRNSSWRFELPTGVGGPVMKREQMLKVHEIPARSDYSIPLAFRNQQAGRRSFRIGVHYQDGAFSFYKSTAIRVGRESLSALRLRSYSVRPEVRAEALVYLRHRLRIGKSDPAFQRTLKIVARSPHADMRRGVAKALMEYGRAGVGGQTELLTVLAADRDLSVVRQAIRGLERRCPMHNVPPETARFGARMMARKADARSRLLIDMLGRKHPRQRHNFLAAVLRSSRSRTVHKRVAELLRSEGVPVEPGGSGLIPRSQIAQLAK
ncbi:MAG: hypothetical protein ACYTGZ_20455 [Planctomycetota bacterium]|jgi:hypothetical protein